MTYDEVLAFKLETGTVAGAKPDTVKRWCERQIWRCHDWQTRKELQRQISHYDFSYLPHCCEALNLLAAHGILQERSKVAS